MVFAGEKLLRSRNRVLLFELYDMNLWSKVIYTLLLLGFYGTLQAQSVKQVEVSAETPYVDHISLLPGSSDMDLLVKIAFDEPNNSLTVSLISYRKLFVFQTNVRYSQVVKGSRLRPERLPYVVASDEQVRYAMGKALRKSIKPERKHIFSRWIEYEGLQPQPTDYKMVNDYIEQRFDILRQQSYVSVTLRDILVMSEPLSDKRPEYELFFQTDLNRRYNITIQRDPCFGKEEALQASAAQLESIRAGYEAFEQKFGKDSKLDSPGSVKIFAQMKSLLLEQFPRKEETNSCPDIQANIDQYNRYVDSIERMECKFTVETRTKARAKAASLGLSADYILTMARRIDNNVNRWLLSSDPMEQKDLITACNQIIDQVRSHVSRASVMTSSQQSAIRVFNEAANYFHRTCVKK